MSVINESLLAQVTAIEYVKGKVEGLVKLADRIVLHLMRVHLVIKF